MTGTSTSHKYSSASAAVLATLYAPLRNVRLGQRCFAYRFKSRTAFSGVVVDFRSIQSIEHTPKMIKAMPVMPAHGSIERRRDLLSRDLPDSRSLSMADRARKPDPWL